MACLDVDMNCVHKYGVFPDAYVSSALSMERVGTRLSGNEALGWTCSLMDSMLHPRAPSEFVLAPPQFQLAAADELPCDPAILHSFQGLEWMTFSSPS